MSPGDNVWNVLLLLLLLLFALLPPLLKFLFALAGQILLWLFHEYASGFMCFFYLFLSYCWAIDFSSLWFFLMFFLVSVCMYTHSRKTNVGKVKCFDFSYSAVWWVSTRSSLPHWKYNSQCSQCREKFLFVRIALGGVCYWHLVKRRGDPANHTTMPRMEPCNEELPDPKHQ